LGCRERPEILLEKSADREVVKPNVIPLMFRKFRGIRQNADDRARLAGPCILTFSNENHPIAI